MLFASVLVALLVIRTLAIEPVRVRSDSMAPTIQDGDALVIDKLTYLFRDPLVGEIVITADPQSGDVIVKRVVAVGGDEIGIEDGVLIRNGDVVTDDVTDADDSGMDGRYFGPITVPAGEVFVLGDNRVVSIDSRAFGTLVVDDIGGRVLAHVWPLGGH